MGIVFGKGQRIVMIGDSITDCGRREAPLAPHGNGYVSLVRALLQARYPELGLEVINTGVGGDTVQDLEQRWQQDAVDHKPDWLSVKIGINDTWRHLDSDGPIDEVLAAYEACYRDILARAKQAGNPRLILLDPYVIEADKEERFRVLMAPLLPIVKKLAEEFGAIHVPVQGAFDEALAGQTDSGYWAEDRIHPGLPGHAVIALAWLRAVGFAV